MFSLAFALLVTLTPSTIPQGQVARIKAPATAVSAHLLGKTIPLFAESDGTRTGLIPIPALGPLPAGTRSNESTRTVRSSRARQSRFKTRISSHRTSSLARSLQNLKPAPGELETLAALRNTVSPTRYWTEPFEVPVSGCSTSPFGVKRLYNGKASGNFHSGLDQRSPMGTPIRAITGGVVKIVRKFNINGDVVGIDHGHGMTSFYLHMSKFATTEGATIKQGRYHRLRRIQWTIHRSAPALGAGCSCRTRESTAMDEDKSMRPEAGDPTETRPVEITAINRPLI